MDGINKLAHKFVKFCCVNRKVKTGCNFCNLDLKSGKSKTIKEGT